MQANTPLTIVCVRAEDAIPKDGTLLPCSVCKRNVILSDATFLYPELGHGEPFNVVCTGCEGMQLM